MSALLPGLCGFFHDLSRSRAVREGARVLLWAHRTGVGCVPRGQGGFFLGLVFRTGDGVSQGMMPVIFLLTLLIRAGLGFCFGFGIIRFAVRPKSGCHRQGFVFPY